MLNFKIRTCFILHFIFAAMVHVLTPIMLIGLVQALVASELGFFISGAILGCCLYSLQFIVNHLTNPDSFCILNDLENFYRREARLAPVGSFLPRFYEMCIRIFKKDWRIPL